MPNQCMACMYEAGVRILAGEVAVLLLLIAGSSSIAAMPDVLGCSSLDVGIQMCSVDIEAEKIYKICT